MAGSLADRHRAGRGEGPGSAPGTRNGGPAMRLAKLGIGLLLLGVAAGGVTVERAGDLVVHEWGTFLGMSGSDGVALDGMYHEEHALPAFVHARSRDQLRLPSALLKGEPPVIYFYPAAAQVVGISVRFPRGPWTRWDPRAH